MAKLSTTCKCLLALVSLSYNSSNYAREAALSSSASLQANMLSHEATEGDAQLIKALFAERELMAANEAYESVFFDELVAKQKSDNDKLVHQQEIALLDSQIEKLRQDKAKQTNPKAIEKLELKEKDLLLEKAHLEIQDAPILSYYSQSEYDKLTVKVSEAFARSKVRIESRAFVASEIQRLFSSAETHMKVAAEKMAAGFGLNDRIAQTETNRLAFAHEALAIAQLEQILDVQDKLDVLLNYSNEEIIAMVNGTEVVEHPKPQALPVQVEMKAEVEKPAADPVAQVPAAKEIELLINETQPKVKEEEKLEVEVLMPLIAKANVRKVERAKTDECDLTQISDAIFYTVQIGAFQKQIELSTFEKVGKVCTDRTSNSLIRYTSGHYQSLGDAQTFLNSVKKAGIADAFITAYANGKRVTVSEATELLRRSSN